jgi:hypothetical protein
MRDSNRWLMMLLAGACASVPPAHPDPARDPANPEAREASVLVVGALPADDPTFKVGKPPFESGESGTQEGSGGGHHHHGAAPPASRPEQRP